MDEYIGNQAPEVRERLEKLRQMILTSAPNIEESIAYGMPAYKTFGKPLVYFAAYPKHIGLYATPSGHSHFEKELKAYKQGKGSVQFPLNQDLPYGLILHIVKFRVQENINKFGVK